uniref:DOMON domain-containing protein n=1 Tax=Nelumbo nucifera TaxID=4432 RepID=A0A822Y0E0_NELNU|nr:TPA_asm: hypothetical protein HUJ06_026180 [Nelumbo nucifera]
MKNCCLAGETSPSEWSDIQFPEAEVLILDFYSMNYTLPQFIEKMVKLEILIIVNRGNKQAKLTGLLQLSNLTKFKKIRLEKIAVPSLNSITVPLKSLEKISLIMCGVSEAFTNCNVKIPNAFSDLRELDMGYCHDLVNLPPGIGHSVHLQKLSITNCQNLSALPGETGRLKDLEMLRLHACSRLRELPGSIRELQKLKFLDLSCCLRGLMKLDLRRCSHKMKLPESVKKLVQLEKMICDDETSTIWEHLKLRHLPQLNIDVRSEQNNSLAWLGLGLN